MTEKLIGMWTSILSRREPPPTSSKSFLQKSEQSWSGFNQHFNCNIRQIFIAKIGATFYQNSWSDFKQHFTKKFTSLSVIFYEKFRKFGTTEHFLENFTRF